MKQAQQIRILIAEDNPAVREGLAALINRRPDMVVVAEASQGQAVAELFDRYRPDVALIDPQMLDPQGLKAIASLRDRYPAASIVVLSTLDYHEDIYCAAQAGAKGYLPKDSPRDELFECIHRVYQGKTYLRSDRGRKGSAKV